MRLKERIEEQVSGMKFDQSKPRWDLLPLHIVERVVEVLTMGAEKYADNNWQKVNNAEARYFAAAMRHLSADQKGEQIDPESKLPHLAHAACNMLFLLWFRENKPNINSKCSTIADKRLQKYPVLGIIGLASFTFAKTKKRLGLDFYKDIDRSFMNELYRSMHGQIVFILHLKEPNRYFKILPKTISENTQTVIIFGDIAEVKNDI